MTDRSFLRLHRLALISLTAMFAAFLLWAFLGRLDIVVTAVGKLVPTNYVQLAQPAESGIVRKVLVKDGDEVKAGQPLIEMDPVYAREDATAAEAEVAMLKQRLLRIEAETTGLAPKISDPSVLAEYSSRKYAHRSNLDEAQRIIDRARAELASAQEKYEKYRQLSPVAARQANMLERLKAEGFVSEAALNDKLLGKIDTERERSIQASAVESARAGVRQAESTIRKIEAEYQKQLAIERADVTLRLLRAEADRAKNAHRADLTVLKAPVAGTVTGLKLKTAGEVVAAGAPLLSLVPKNEALRFEGWLRNEDSAFVIPGMTARVKLSAYPFQKYGWLDGEMSWLGVDSEVPDSMKNAQGEPLFYKVRVTLPAQSLSRDGKTYPLKSGMQAVTDVHVGTRTLFEYLTSPIRKVAMEAARER